MSLFSGPMIEKLPKLVSVGGVNVLGHRIYAYDNRIRIFAPAGEIMTPVGWSKKQYELVGGAGHG